MLPNLRLLPSSLSFYDMPAFTSISLRQSRGEENDTLPLPHWHAAATRMQNNTPVPATTTMTRERNNMPASTSHMSESTTIIRERHIVPVNTVARLRSPEAASATSA